MIPKRVKHSSDESDDSTTGLNKWRDTRGRKRNIDAHHHTPLISSGRAQKHQTVWRTEVKGENTLQLFVKSVGCFDAPFHGTNCEDTAGAVKINGNDVSQNKNGFNIVVVDFKTGDLEKSLSFDTHGEAGAFTKLVELLSTLEDWKIVCIAVKNDANNYLPKSALKVFEMVGAFGAAAGNIEYRSSYAFVGLSGPEPSRARVNWLREETSKAGEGPSIISIDIKIGLKAFKKAGGMYPSKKRKSSKRQKDNIELSEKEDEDEEFTTSNLKKQAGITPTVDDDSDDDDDDVTLVKNDVTSVKAATSLPFTVPVINENLESNLDLASLLKGGLIGNKPSMETISSFLPVAKTTQGDNSKLSLNAVDPLVPAALKSDVVVQNSTAVDAQIETLKQALANQKALHKTLEKVKKEREQLLPSSLNINPSIVENLQRTLNESSNPNQLIATLKPQQLAKIIAPVDPVKGLIEAAKKLGINTEEEEGGKKKSTPIQLPLDGLSIFQNLIAKLSNSPESKSRVAKSYEKTPKKLAKPLHLESVEEFDKEGLENEAGLAAEKLLIDNKVEKLKTDSKMDFSEAQLINALKALGLPEAGASGVASLMVSGMKANQQNNTAEASLKLGLAAKLAKSLADLGGRGAASAAGVSSLAELLRETKGGATTTRLADQLGQALAKVGGAGAAVGYAALAAALKGTASTSVVAGSFIAKVIVALAEQGQAPGTAGLAALAAGLGGSGADALADGLGGSLPHVFSEKAVAGGGVTAENVVSAAEGVVDDTTEHGTDLLHAFDAERLTSSEAERLTSTPDAHVTTTSTAVVDPHLPMSLANMHAITGTLPLDLHSLADSLPHQTPIDNLAHHEPSTLESPIRHPHHPSVVGLDGHNPFPPAETLTHPSAVEALSHNVAGSLQFHPSNVDLEYTGQGPIGSVAQGNFANAATMIPADPEEARHEAKHAEGHTAEPLDSTLMQEMIENLPLGQGNGDAMISADPEETKHVEGQEKGHTAEPLDSNLVQEMIEKLPSGTLDKVVEKLKERLMPVADDDRHTGVENSAALLEDDDRICEENAYSRHCVQQCSDKKTLIGRYISLQSTDKRAVIKVNGEDWSKDEQGFNFVVLDFNSGEVEATESFDTEIDGGAAKSMTNFLKSLPPGKVVLGATHGNAGELMVEPTYRALSEAGGQKLLKNHLHRGDKYVLLGVTGTMMPWQQENLVQLGEDQAEINAPIVVGAGALNNSCVCLRSCHAREEKLRHRDELQKGSTLSELAYQSVGGDMPVEPGDVGTKRTHQKTPTEDTNELSKAIAQVLHSHSVKTPKHSKHQKPRPDQSAKYDDAKKPELISVTEDAQLKKEVSDKLENLLKSQSTEKADQENHDVLSDDVKSDILAQLSEKYSREDTHENNSGGSQKKDRHFRVHPSVKHLTASIFHALHSIKAPRKAGKVERTKPALRKVKNEVKEEGLSMLSKKLLSEQEDSVEQTNGKEEAEEKMAAAMENIEESHIYDDIYSTIGSNLHSRSERPRPKKNRG